jgi:hypothetical protein
MVLMAWGDYTCILHGQDFGQNKREMRLLGLLRRFLGMSHDFLNRARSAGIYI